MTTSVDETMNRIARAIGSRATLDELWREIGPDGDPLHVVTLAHFLADVQDTPEAKQEWDLRALAAAESLTEERARSYHESLSVHGFFPSLHANVADNYAAMGRYDLAREHLAKAHQHVHLLRDDAYGAVVRSYLAKIESRL